MSLDNSESSDRLFINPILMNSDLDSLIKFLTLSLEMRSVPEDHSATVVGHSRSVVATTLDTIADSLAESDSLLNPQIISLLRSISKDVTDKTDLDVVSIIIDSLINGLSAIDPNLIAALTVVRKYPTISNWKTAVTQFAVFNRRG